MLASTTVGDEAEARRLSTEAVAQGLAACVQIDTIRSVYRWQGRVHDEPEWRLLFKTLESALPALRDWLHARHPYELPQWLVWPAAASEAYQDWVADSLQAPDLPAQDSRA